MMEKGAPRIAVTESDVEYYGIHKINHITYTTHDIIHNKQSWHTLNICIKLPMCQYLNAVKVAKFNASLF